jgi:hypothetical protein
VVLVLVAGVVVDAVVEVVAGVVVLVLTGGVVVLVPTGGVAVLVAGGDTGGRTWWWSRSQRWLALALCWLSPSWSPRSLAEAAVVPAARSATTAIGMVIFLLTCRVLRLNLSPRSSQYAKYGFRNQDS